MTDAIKLTCVNITPNSLSVSSNCTTYLSETLPEKVDIQALMARFKQLCARARGKGIKISNKYKTRKFVADNAAQYEEEYAKYLEAFNATAALAKVIFVDKPLLVGTSDNDELHAMYVHRNGMERLWYRTTVFNKVYEFVSRVDSMERQIDFIGDGNMDMSFFF